MREIYLDNASTTQTSPEVLRRFVTISEKVWGNPGNTAHSYGRKAKAIQEEARRSIGKTLGLDPKGIIFTSGATEANNLALRGAGCLKDNKCALLISSVEHACVDESAKVLKQQGIPVHAIRVDQNGILDFNHLQELINKQPVKLVSILLVNNETGVIQPLEQIAKLVKSKGILLHTDAVQAIGKLPNSILQHADMVSLSGHKIHAPKGVGMLWVAPHVKLKPLLVGGGQEAGLRSGTCPVPLIAALAVAIEQTRNRRWIPAIQTALRTLEAQIQQYQPDVIVNGQGAPRVGTISNISFPTSVIDKLRHVAASSGAACGCAKAMPSKVLLQMGRTQDYAKNALRLSASRFTSPQEILVATDYILDCL